MIPCSSSTCGLSIPRLNRERSSTPTIESIRPRIMLPRIINAFFGFSTPGWVMAGSTIRTSPTVLASVIFSSCCLFSSCM
ncbi:hypothetical protein D3C78_1475300 [compost metagenome]